MQAADQENLERLCLASQKERNFKIEFVEENFNAPADVQVTKLEAELLHPLYCGKQG